MVEDAGEDREVVVAVVERADVVVGGVFTEAGEEVGDKRRKVQAVCLIAATQGQARRPHLLLTKHRNLLAESNMPVWIEVI